MKKRARAATPPLPTVTEYLSDVFDRYNEESYSTYCDYVDTHVFINNGIPKRAAFMKDVMDGVHPLTKTPDEEFLELWQSAKQAERDACIAKYYPKLVLWIRTAIRRNAVIAKKLMQNGLDKFGIDWPDEVVSAYEHAMSVFDTDIESVVQ